jgi:ATP-binding cassette subfamily B protein/subfamily B ATP-binding cassette protein MsbA
VKPHVLTFGILLALNFFSLVFSFVSPLLTKSLVDDVFIGKRVEIFVYIIMGIVGIYCMSSISGYFAGYISGKLQLILLKEVSESAFNVVQSTSVKSTQGMKVGDLITRIMSNTQVAINIPVSVIPHFIMSLIGIIIPFIIMLSLNVHLALIITSPVILFVLSSFIFGKKMEIIQKAFLEINGEVYSFLKENISIIPLIKVFGLEKWSQNRFKNQMDNYYNISIGYTKINSMNASLSTLILGIPVVLLIFFGGYMVLNGSISIGTFTAFISYISIFFSPISQLSNFWTSYKSSLPAFDRVKEIFDMEHEIGGHKEIEIKNGEIQLENVWFSYGERPILKGVSAIFGKGLNYIVGDNGTGKSTILKLICLFYPVNNGIIKLEGHNIAEIKKDCLNRNISMIFSEPYIFDGSIYENIKIGNLHASMDQVIQVAKKVKFMNL